MSKRTSHKRGPKYIFNGPWDDNTYILAWSYDRSSYCIQVWNSNRPEGEPDGDWIMPKILGLNTAIAQAILQSK